MTDENTRAIAKISDTLAFFQSVIKSGESWSQTCVKEYTAARDALVALDTALAPTTQGTEDDVREAALRAMHILQTMGDSEEGVTLAFRTLAEVVNV